MRKSLLLISFVLFISCSQKNCDAEMAKLTELRVKGWQNCNGNADCIKKIESDYQKRVAKLNCD